MVGFSVLLVGLVAALVWWFASTPADTGAGPLLTGARLIVEEALACLVVATIIVAIVTRRRYNEAQAAERTLFTRIMAGAAYPVAVLLSCPMFFLVAIPSTWYQEIITVTADGFGSSQYVIVDNDPQAKVYNETASAVTVCAGENGTCTGGTYVFSYTIDARHRIGFPLPKPNYQFTMTVAGVPTTTTTTTTTATVDIRYKSNYPESP